MKISALTGLHPLEDVTLEVVGEFATRATSRSQKMVARIAEQTMVPPRYVAQLLIDLAARHVSRVPLLGAGDTVSRNSRDAFPPPSEFLESYLTKAGKVALEVVRGARGPIPFGLL